MNIEEAKSDLEKQIIYWDGVIGIGVINENNTPVIEIAIDKKDTTVVEKLNKLINENHWHGHKVKIVPTDEFKLHN